MDVIINFFGGQALCETSNQLPIYIYMTLDCGFAISSQKPKQWGSALQENSENNLNPAGLPFLTLDCGFAASS